ncbi:HK97-gp10 family putative phage morphogenesis protein [Micromonospora sp. NPDC049891]|uniref:HK97-gp10 family putative phage morphogenesis protein n=1 Tax=Micromonospora sp. NPDC049891 TaxID=3155655 RepID=UPI0033E5E44A
MARRQTVTVDGMGLLSKRLKQLPGKVQDGLRAAVRDETNDVVDDMRRTAPRDTGDLVRGMQTEITSDGLGGRAVSTARHSTFVEHGTEDTPEQPFMAPAAERARRRFPGRVKDAVGVELKDLTR